MFFSSYSICSFIPRLLNQTIIFFSFFSILSPSVFFLTSLPTFYLTFCTVILSHFSFFSFINISALTLLAVTPSRFSPSFLSSLSHGLGLGLVRRRLGVHRHKEQPRQGREEWFKSSHPSYFCGAMMDGLAALGMM